MARLCFQTLMHYVGEAYFLSGASSDTTLEDEVGVVKVNDSAAATQNGMFANVKSLAQLDDSFVARSFDLRLAGDAISGGHRWKCRMRMIIPMQYPCRFLD